MSMAPSPGELRAAKAIKAEFPVTLKNHSEASFARIIARECGTAELVGIVEERGREILKSKKNYREREGRMREWAWFLKILREPKAARAARAARAKHQP